MTHYFLPTEAAAKEGIKALQKGRVALVVLAGGLGSRFGNEMPKGTYPISQVKEKSLFQLIAEKTIAVAKAYGTMPHIAIMTSEDTHAQTLQHFSKANFFDLPQEFLSFFIQSSLPLLDDNGLPAVTQNGEPLTAPNGNGLFYLPLSTSGILEKWKNAGVECITVVLVDNPLADPFSTALIGLHKEQKDDITLVAVERTDPEEHVGVVIENNGNFSVVEYSEIPPDEYKARDANNRLKYPLANISFFAFNLPFIEQMARDNPARMPLHSIKKQISASQQLLLGHNNPLKLWKFEYFIFDLLTFTNKTSVLLLDRQNTFCPLKNGSGKYGPAAVKQALLKKDRMQFHAISNVAPPQDRLFELSMQFYYPTEELLAKWKNRPLPDEPYLI